MNKSVRKELANLQRRIHKVAQQADYTCEKVSLTAQVLNNESSMFIHFWRNNDIALCLYYNKIKNNNDVVSRVKVDLTSTAHK